MTNKNQFFMMEIMYALKNTKYSFMDIYTYVINEYEYFMNVKDGKGFSAYLKRNTSLSDQQIIDIGYSNKLTVRAVYNFNLPEIYMLSCNMLQMINEDIQKQIDKEFYDYCEDYNQIIRRNVLLTGIDYLHEDIVNLYKDDSLMKKKEDEIILKFMNVCGYSLIDSMYVYNLN